MTENEAQPDEMTSANGSAVREWYVDFQGED
jgi:hypothetical protein